MARKLFCKISRFCALLLSLILVLLFASMIGWTASIMRAAFVSMLSLVAWFVGRKFKASRLLILVMAMTLIIDPMFLLNLGWLLSFAAFGGIMILEPGLEKFFYGEQKVHAAAKIILTTIAATVMCLPIQLYCFGTFSLISILANFLILPTVSCAMGTVFLTGLLAFCPPIAFVLGKMTDLIIGFHLLVINCLGEQKMFLVDIGAKNPLVFLLYIPILTPFIVAFLREKFIIYDKTKCQCRRK